MKIEGVVQPLHSQLHPVGAVDAGSIDLGGGDAGAVDALFEQMYFAGDAVLPQRCEQQQSVFHGNGGVLHRVPDKDGRGVRRDLIFQREFLVVRRVLAAGQP